MDKRARVLAALRGEAVDHVPISFWGHHYAAENSADGLAQQTLRQLRRFDWDFLKPQSRAQAFAEMWGLTYTPSRVAHQKYTTTHVPVAGPAELARLQPADPTAGALGEQLQALRTIRAAAGPSVPIIWTVFSPLMIARYLLPGDAAQLLEIARTEPDALTVALEAIAETLVGYVRACLASGADGVFYATNLATREMLSIRSVRPLLATRANWVSSCRRRSTSRRSRAEAFRRASTVGRSRWATSRSWQATASSSTG